jgi:hypothetical protein
LGFGLKVAFSSLKLSDILTILEHPEELAVDTVFEELSKLYDSACFKIIYIV